jgi:cysteine sulfinate desulfinase/cysteine desulfurase-like protein
MITLDHNATTPLRPEGFETRLPFLTERSGNPSSSYAFRSSLKSVIEAARAHVAALLGASAREIVFTGIESEALLLLLDQSGICGSACLADSDEPSHVVRAMKPERAASKQMVRFSRERGATAADIAQNVQDETNPGFCRSLLAGDFTFYRVTTS